MIYGQIVRGVAVRERLTEMVRQDLSLQVVLLTTQNNRIMKCQSFCERRQEENTFKNSSCCKNYLSASNYTWSIYLFVKFSFAPLSVLIIFKFQLSTNIRNWVDLNGCAKMVLKRL